MKEFFANKRNVILMLTGLALIIWYFWTRRWKRFTDNGQAGELARIYTGTYSLELGGLLGFVATEPHGLKLGDKVEIEQDSGARFASYNGTFDVAGIINDRVFAVAHSFEGNTPANPGKFRKA